MRLIDQQDCPVDDIFQSNNVVLFGLEMFVKSGSNFSARIFDDQKNHTLIYCLGIRLVMKRLLAISVMIFLSIGKGWCQRNSAADSTTVLIGQQTDYGKILPHSKEISGLTDSHLWGLQVDISRIRYTKASWNICNCYSQNGISLVYFDFNNPNELGRSAGFTVFAEPQITFGRLFSSFRVGAGITYQTRIYHPDNNPRNLFFSSPWSGLLMMQLSGRYRVSNLWSIRLGAAYHHISNGGNRQPNKGMNFPVISIGAEYATRSLAFPRRARYAARDKSIHYYAGLFYNSRSVDASNVTSNERKMSLGLQGGFYKPIAHMHAFGAAIELSHDGSLKELARQNYESYDHHVVSALARHHFLFGRFDFSQAMGFYLHKEYPNPNRVFQRYVIQYRIFKKLYAGFSLKAHLHVAEQMDLRLGVVL